jgi:hypothetical protein
MTTRPAPALAEAGPVRQLSALELFMTAIAIHSVFLRFGTAPS